MVRSWVGNVDVGTAFVGDVRGGIARTFTYDADSCVGTFELEGSALANDILKGSLIRVGNWSCFYVISNTAREIRVWGGFPPGESFAAPSRWVEAYYHILSTSPDRALGIGPSANPAVPVEDIDGDVRSGSTTDIGMDQYSEATAPKSPAWGRLWITASATSADLGHVVVRGGRGVYSDLATVSVVDCDLEECTEWGFSQRGAESSPLRAPPQPGTCLAACRFQGLTGWLCGGTERRQWAGGKEHVDRPRLDECGHWVRKRGRGVVRGRLERQPRNPGVPVR